MSSLYKDTFFYSLANWSRRLVSFVVAPITIAYFTPADYGYMSLVMTVGSFCSIIGLLAIADQGVARFFVDSKDESEKTSYASTSFFVCSVSVSCIAFIILASTPFIPFLFEDVQVPIVFTSLIAVICLTQSIQYVGSNMLKWTFQSPLFTKITLIHTLVGASLTIGGVVLLGWRAKEVLLVGATVALGAGIWANLSIKQYIKFSTISKKRVKELVTYSWPLLGLSVFAFFTRSLDRIFLASLASLREVGIFSVSSAVAAIFDTVVSGFFLPGVPMCFQHFTKNGLRGVTPNSSVLSLGLALLA